MMQQWLVSTERNVRAGAVVCAAAAMLLIPTTLHASGSGTTAEAARSSRLHHISAGHAQSTAPSTSSRSESAKSGSNKSGSRAKAGSAKKSDAKPPVASKAKPHKKKKAEPEDVSDPFPMHQARSARPGHGEIPRQIASRNEAARTHEIARVEAAPKITVPARISRGTSVTASVMHPALAEGVSRPEQAEPGLDTTIAGNNVVAAPIVRSTSENTSEASDDTATDAGSMTAETNASVPDASSVPATKAVAADTHELAAVSTFDREDVLGDPVVTHQPELTMHNGRVVMPAPLKGSHEVLVHQNLMADDEHLDRIQDDEELEALIAHHQLVNFSENAGLRLNPELPGERRVARVWTVRFAEDMARNFYERFHQPLIISSAVRTVMYQLRLQRVNGNAAAVDGDGASPHLTGQAIDIAKRGMSPAELAWMREYLLPLMQAGKIDVEEEFKQSCFHISVYKSYLPPARRRAMEVAQMQEVGSRK